MEKVQRLDGYGLEKFDKLNDSLRYSLLPPEKVPLLSLLYFYTKYLNEIVGVMILQRNL